MRVCGRLVAGISGSNPSEGMDVCLLCLYVVLSCVGIDLCDGLITSPKESYRVCLIVYDQETIMVEENLSSEQIPKNYYHYFVLLSQVFFSLVLLLLTER
jgi:hypothetical protein